MSNRLSRETSPYLLQHQHNPVDWYPWGEEALARAREEDRPILLSVGYSACHWCHVMERESFEDEETARQMNEHFVNIKVDREERPDIDSIYMNAVQQMTGRGGWPMTVFLTPAGVPFYGGTYFPPEPRHGMPSFRQVLEAVAEAYRSRREEVEKSAEELRRALEEHNTLLPPHSALDAMLLDRAVEQIAPQFDGRHGGFGRAPKFPQPMLLEFLLRQWERTHSSQTLRMADHTLRSMARGGIYDHLGGGFHRYSVDAEWLVPHFEKMLYDNALLARVYLYAHQVTGDAEYRRVVEETLGYAMREMLSPEGGFYSAQDADSEREEGKFYVWGAEEVDALLGPEDGPLFRRYYGVTESGNWEGANILHAEHDLDGVAVAAGVPEARLEEALERGRSVLFTRRAERVRPGTDEKVITSWNAMMLRAFAEAAAALDDRRYLEVAERNADFLLRELRTDTGGLLRTYRDGTAKIGGFLEDYALLADALAALYQVSFDPRWVRDARDLVERMLQEFWDPEAGVFYDVARSGEQLLIRPRDVYDNATPSGNSAAVTALLKLAVLVGEPRYERIAVRVLENLAAAVTQYPSAFGQLLCALDFHLATPREVAIVGAPEADDTRALVGVVAGRFRPNTIVALREAEVDPAVEELIPLLAQRGQIDRRATAYVCRHFACRQPVTDPAALEAQLDGEPDA